MDILYKVAPPIEETELEFYKRKALDRSIFIGVQKAEILKLKRILGDASDIMEEAWK